MSAYELTTVDDRGIIPFNIGIAPSEPRKPVILQSEIDAAANRTLGTFSNRTGVILSVNEQIIDATGETLTSLEWPEYAAWRRTKCMPRNLNRDVLPSPVQPELEDAFRKVWPKQEWIEEIDQATHELVGETAELGELFAEFGPATFFGDHRVKLIDECGDILFCASWALDAWGVNPLEECDDLEFVRVEEDTDLATFARVVASIPMYKALQNPTFVAALVQSTLHQLLTIQTNAGLTANAFKKLKFQRREQDTDKQVNRIMQAIFATNVILVLANSSIEDAIKSNMKKLDARFPLGYQPGVGGGIRTGDGK